MLLATPPGAQTLARPWYDHWHMVQRHVSVEEFRRQPPEFWALVKLVSQLLGYSERKRGDVPGRIKRYDGAAIAAALRERGLDPDAAGEHIERVVGYSEARADLLENVVAPNLMSLGRLGEARHPGERTLPSPGVAVPEGTVRLRDLLARYRRIRGNGNWACCRGWLGSARRGTRRACRLGHDGSQDSGAAG